MLVSDLIESTCWENILANIEPTEVPMNCVKKMVVEFADGSQETLDLGHLRSAGTAEDVIEASVNHFLDLHTDEVVETNCIIDVERVGELLSPYTQNLLNRVTQR